MMTHKITLAYLKENAIHHLKVIEQKYINTDDHPSVYMTLRQPSEV